MKAIFLLASTLSAYKLHKPSSNLEFLMQTFDDGGKVGGESVVSLAKRIEAEVLKAVQLAIEEKNKLYE